MSGKRCTIARMTTPPPPRGPQAAAPPSDPPSSLPRQLGLFSAIAVLIGSTIGSGIFRSPAGIADKLPGPLPLMAVWITGGIFSLCGALTLAEIAGALPKTGGHFVFIREGWGRLAAFLYGWSELVIIRAASLGAISMTFAEYLLRLLGFDPSIAPYDSYAHYVAAVALAVIAGLNIVGLKWGALVQNVTTIAKYGGLLLIIMLAFAIGLPKTGGHFTPATPEGSFSVGMFGLALVSVLWAFDGWADLTKVGGEVANPRETIPKALVLGTIAVVAIYLLANLAYLSVMTVDEIRGAKLVAADVADRLVGRAGVTFVSVTVLLSTFGAMNGVMLTGPRIFFAMADDGLFFRQVAAVHPKYKTPYVAILLAAAIGIAFVLFRTFEQLADIFVTASLLFYIMSVGAVFSLRRRPDWNPPVRVPLYPVVPALFVAATFFLLGNSLYDASTRMGTLGVLGVIAVGIPVFFATVGRTGSAR